MGLSIGPAQSSGRGITSVATRLRSKFTDRTPGILKDSPTSGLDGTTRAGIMTLRGGVSGVRSNMRAVAGVRRAIDVRA